MESGGHVYRAPITRTQKYDLPGCMIRFTLACLVYPNQICVDPRFRASHKFLTAAPESGTACEIPRYSYIWSVSGIYGLRNAYFHISGVLGQLQFAFFHPARSRPVSKLCEQYNLDSLLYVDICMRHPIYVS